MSVALSVMAWVIAGVLAVVVVAMVGRLRSVRSAADSQLARSAAETNAVLDDREAWRDIVEALPMPVIVADASGAPAFANAAGAAVIEAGLSTVLVGRSVRAALIEAVGGASVTRREEFFGPPVQRFVISAVPIRNGGAVAVVEDASVHARTDAVRRDFVANISHELKTPVGALMVLAEALVAESDAVTSDGDVLRRLGTRMGEEADLLASTVDDLLALSTIEFGLGEDVAEFELCGLVAEVIDRYAGSAEDAGIRLSHDVPPALHIAGDRRQLASAVSHLVENAVKYSTAGTTVSIGAEADSDRVVLTVRDEGIGIPAGDRARIFERFYRVDRARSRRTGGTGLGLAIVRHVVANHGGTVTVDSEEGRGSAFHLELPSRSGAEPTAPAGPSDEEPS